MRRLLGDASGSVADLGVLVPITGALVVHNGVDASAVLVSLGVLYVTAGLYFGVPVPVQPVKAASAIAIARGLPPEALSHAALILGIVLATAAATGISTRLARWFTPSLIRGLQLGVGVMLVGAAGNLVAADGGAVVAAVLVCAAAAAGAAAHAHGVPFALVAVAAGVAVSLAGVGLGLPGPSPAMPSPAGFDAGILWTAFILLVIPQIPLTFGNAVVAVVDLERRYYGSRAERVTPRAISASAGIANVVSAVFGGIPMCHGSNGLTAHYRAGATTRSMNLMIGSALVVIGVVFADEALALLAVIPLPVLATLLAFTGFAHSALVVDRRGVDLLVSLAVATAGVLTANLAVGLAAGAALEAVRRWRRAPAPEPAAASSSG